MIRNHSGDGDGEAKHPAMHAIPISFSMYLFHDLISICASNNSSLPLLRLFLLVLLVYIFGCS